MRAYRLLEGNGGIITLKNNLQISFYKTSYYDKELRRDVSVQGFATDLGLTVAGKVVEMLKASIAGSLINSIGLCLLMSDGINLVWSAKVSSILDDENNIGVAIVEGTSLWGSEMTSIDLPYGWQKDSYLTFLSENFGNIKNVEVF